MVSEKRKGKSKKDEENPNPPSPIPEEASDEEAFEMKDLTKTVSWSESEDQGSSSRLQSKPVKPPTNRRRSSIMERLRSRSMSTQDEDEEEDYDSDETESDEDAIKVVQDDPPPQARRGSLTVPRHGLQKQTSRYEERIKSEEIAVQAAYQKRKDSRKYHSKSKSVKAFEPTQEEAYDFFTKEDWLPDTATRKSDTEEKSDDNIEVDDENDPEGQEGDKRKLIESSQFIGEKYLWEMTEKGSAFIDNRDNDVTYTVSNEKVALEQKLGSDRQPRFPEEEGMYIGFTPVTKTKNQNKLENRILKEGSQVPWFGEDGKLVALPNPIQRKATRPPNFEDSMSDDVEQSLTYFCSPMLPLPDGTPAPIQNSGRMASIAQCQLEVDISSIVFDHHHLFSLEHYLATKLSEQYVAYSKVRSSQSNKDLDKRLGVLYQSIDELKANKDNWLDEEKDFQARRLLTYRDEIKLLREERDSDSFKERELTRSLLQLWKDIRDIRSRNGYTNTSHKLVIRKESMNLTSDKVKWDSELRRELYEAKDYFTDHYDEALKQFEKDLEKWTEMHHKRKEARKRQKQRIKDAERGSGSADAAEMAEDEAILADRESDRPERPDHFNEEQVRRQLEQHAMECRRPPGEPRIHLELIHNPSLIKNEQVQDNREINRRNAVSKTKIFTRVYFNGKEVCQSTAKPMPQDFVIQLGQIFPIQIVQWPETLTLQIIEGSTLKTTVLAEIKLPLCEASKTLSDSSVEPINFVSDLKLSHDHAGLGSGCNFPVNNDGSSISQEMIKGRLFGRVGWGRGSDGSILAPPADQWKPRSDSKLDPLREVMDVDGRIDPEKLEEWIAHARLDPNDPENEELLSRVNEARRKAEISASTTGTKSSSILGGDGSAKVTGKSSSSSSSYFRLDQHQDQLVFCTDAELHNNVRFQMIQLRRAKVLEFKNYRMIPILDKEVPKGLLEARTKRALAKGKEVMDRGDPLRGRSRLYLEQLRAQVSHRFSLARHRRRHGDVVIEDPIPDSGTLLQIFGEMVPAQRPLRPIRIERKKVLMQDLTGQEIKILLSVVRAYDVPIRCDPDPMVQGSGLQRQQSKEGIEENSVCSYIEAQFQGSTARTTIAIGPNPAWNQELTLTFKSANNDYSPETLNRIKDSLHLHLFDEVKVDLVEDEMERASKIHQRIEKKWLGSLSIPFSSLYRNTRIEGTFRLHSPPVLLGYERSGVVGGLFLGSEGTGLAGGSQGLARNTKNATYLNIYATLQPALIVPEPVKEKLDCDESDLTVQHCQTWKRDLAIRFPHRKVNPLVADVTGKSVLMTRYFKAIKPPQELLDNAGDAKATISSVSWFVSLIPYVASNVLFPGLQDIWPTCDQFLSMMVGSEIEHALLLCNFFSGLSKKAFLVIGKGVPEGDTSYVLTVEESGEHLLWNPVTGEHFSTTETFCPLEAVYAIVNEGNVWGNLQPSDRPSRLRWDLSATSDWVPLFSRGFANPGLPSVQPAEVHVSSADHRIANQLKERVERILRDTLMTLRKKMNERTKIDFQGNAVLRKLLPGLEASRGGLTTISEGTGNGVSADHLGELQRIVTSHKVCGFPLHFAFGELDSLVEAVTATGVHLNREPGVEFALAVHVVPYPNTAMSVWIYVASMVRRR